MLNIYQRDHVGIRIRDPDRNVIKLDEVLETSLPETMKRDKNGL